MSVQYGGIDADYQYRVDFVYEALPIPFSNFHSGIEQVLDLRIRKVTVCAKHSETGVAEERWHYDLAYQDEGLAPASYLSSIQQVYRSGDAPPATTYTYSLSRDTLSTATLSPAPKLTQVLAQLGTDAFHPWRSATFDSEEDGLVDLEHSADFTLVRQTGTDFVLEPLGDPPADADSYCRHPPNWANSPRFITRIRSGAGDETPYVAYFQGSASNTSLRLCKRDGQRAAEIALTGDWTPTATTRLVDLNRDMRPDLLRVESGSYAILPNTSSVASTSFGEMRRASLSPNVTPDAIWVHDLNGDGVPDLIARVATSLVVWAGTGNFEFASPGTEYPLRTIGGQYIDDLAAYSLTFLDANKDGLTDVVMTSNEGSETYLLVNSGRFFQEVEVYGLRAVNSAYSPPVALDLSGSGNTKLAYVVGGSAHVLAFNRPDTGLMVSADDGRGTVLSFSYDRAPPDAHCHASFPVPWSREPTPVQNTTFGTSRSLLATELGWSRNWSWLTGRSAKSLRALRGVKIGSSMQSRHPLLARRASTITPRHDCFRESSLPME